MREKPELDVHVYVTPRCNLSCTHCYYDAWGLGDDPDGLLTASELATILDVICDEFDADIHLEGGEAFLRSDLAQVFDQVSSNVRRSITITTGGTVAAPLRTDVLRGLAGLRISVEGHTDELQRRVRGVPLEPIRRNARRFASEGVPYIIRATLYSDTAADIPSIVTTFAADGCRTFSFFEFQAVGRGKDSGLAGFSEEQLDEALEGCKEVAQARSDVSLKVCLAPRHGNQLLRRRAGLSTCGIVVTKASSRANLTINWNGDIGVSPWRVTASKTEDVLGNTRNGDLRKLLRNAQRAGDLIKPCAHTSAWLVSLPH